MFLPQLFQLPGQVALVVGGARDLGFDIASTLAEAGSDLVITSRQAAAAEAAARKLTAAHGVRVLPLELDHREHRRVAAAVAEAERWQGRIDILVNNAGGTPAGGPANLLNRRATDVEELIATNLTGVIHCCQEVARGMTARRRGKIINIASVAALVGRDRRVYSRHGLNGQPVDYAAAKAGVVGLTRDLAGLLSPLGICVNAISPGGFERAALPRGFVDDYSNRTPLGRMGRDGVDIKGAALFLASAASDYVTGHNLVVDGGFSLWR